MKLLNCHRPLVAMLAVCCCSSVGVNAQELRENFLSSGVTRKVGGYRPIRAKMQEEAEFVEVLPEELEAPKFGKLELGDQNWAFILDEPEEGEASLYVDSNGDGDLTNDGDAKWTAREVGKYQQYSGSAELELGGERVGVVNLYRFDPKDERRASLKDSVFYYGDFGTEYEFELDGKTHSTFVSGVPSESSSLPIDRDGNGKLSRRFENAKVGVPFNFTGTTYEFALTEGVLSLKESDEPVDQLPLPPNLQVGEKTIEFTAKTMDGIEIDFPSAFAGKIVMLDFWATWCGPCIGEIPNMKEAYSNWHDEGFEILGISFDAPDATEKLQKFLEEKELPWPQIYEGKGWDTAIGNMHDVSGIPFVLLVDGDSGEILATARQLRGPGLSDFIKGGLEKKFDVKLEDKNEKPTVSADDASDEDSEGDDDSDEDDDSDSDK